MADVLCIGAVAYDINIPLDSFLQENTKVHIERAIEEGGGPASNAAYLIAKWGADCAFGGLIGDDIYGKRIEEEFNSVNIDTTLMVKKNGLDTPLSVVIVNRQKGSRTIISRINKDTALKLNMAILKKMNPEVILFDGHELEASLCALREFPYAKTVLDAGSLRKGTEILANRVEYLISSERFALSVTGLTDLKSENNQRKCIDELKKMNGKHVVVTLGGDGLIYEQNGEFYKMEAYPAEAVDTTGAGDIFHGAFAYGLLKQKPFVEALRFANKTASISVSRAGGRKSIPSMEEIKELIGE